MSSKEKLETLDHEKVLDEVAAFLDDFVTPAFGALPKREIELRVFDLLRNLDLISEEATIYSLMTDLKVTRSKASQLLFDLEIRRHGNDKDHLNALIKTALIKTKFAKDGDYFVMEIENPLTLAHMRQKIRELGHISDTSFNSSLVRAPLDAVSDLMLDLIPDDQHLNIKEALVAAGAPDASIKGVLKGALKKLGSKVIGEAADQAAEGLVDGAEAYLGPILNTGVEQITGLWSQLFVDPENDQDE